MVRFKVKCMSFTFIWAKSRFLFHVYVFFSPYSLSQCLLLHIFRIVWFWIYVKYKKAFKNLKKKWFNKSDTDFLWCECVCSGHTLSKCHLPNWWIVSDWSMWVRKGWSSGVCLVNWCWKQWWLSSIECWSWEALVDWCWSCETLVDWCWSERLGNCNNWLFNMFHELRSLDDGLVDRSDYLGNDWTSSMNNWIGVGWNTGWNVAKIWTNLFFYIQ